MVGCSRSRRSNSMTSQKTWINLILRSFVPGTRQKSLPPFSLSRRNCTHRLNYWQILIYFIWNIKSPLNKHTHTHIANDRKFEEREGEEREERLRRKKIDCNKNESKTGMNLKSCERVILWGRWNHFKITDRKSILNSKGKTQLLTQSQNRICVSAVLAAINNTYFHATNFY